MLLLAARVNIRFDVLQLPVSAAQVATVLYVLLLSVPADPVAFVHVAAFQLTAEAAQVTLPAGCVKFAALAWSDSFSCLVADARTSDVAETDTALATVAVSISVTLKVTLEGTVTSACSETLAVSVVV
jgi:hypothetical protein